MKYELKRFSCKSGCQRNDKCAKMPLEISMNGKKSVDIMFITEFPGKDECDENRFLTGKYGVSFRNILNKLSENYNFSYAIAGLFKSKSTEDVMKTSYRSICICRDEVLKREIDFVKPKVIILMGKYSYKFLMGKNPKYGMLVEHGRLVPANILGHECEVVSVQHTTWYVKNDSCVIGFLYEEIRKTLDYVLKGIDYRIPNNFESVTLRTLKDVKNVFNDMKRSKQYVASDTEDDNLNIVYSNNLISLQVCNDGKTGFVIPVIHFDSPFKGRKLDELKNLIYDFYTDKSANILGHIWVNAKFDYHQLIRECKVLEINAPFIDCSFAEYSLEETWSRIRGFPHQKGKFSLFTMAYSRGFSFYDETSSKEKRTILSHLPLKEWEDYGGADVVAPWQIYQSQLRQAETQGYLHNFKKLNERFYTHMCRSTTYVEHCGLSLDYEVLQQLNSNDSIFRAAKDEVMDKFYESEFVLKTNDILSKKMKGIAARGLFGTSRIFNPSKSTHRELLYFDVMNLEPVEDTDGKKENHTDKAFQKEYENIPEVSLLTEFNSIVKMQTGFVTPVATWMNKRSPDKREDFLDFRSRGSFMNDAVTGRLKCVKPNNQQRPSRGKQVNTILSMYKAPKERVCIKLDYKTFEVKGLGFMSGDKIMVSSFTEMHNLVKEFRKNPTIYTDNGYNEALDTLKKRKKELIERKKALSCLKNKDKDNAKKSYLEEVEKYKKDLASLKDSYENDRIALSMAWLTNQIDFHRKSASLFNGVSLTEVTKAMRQKAKGLVFGSIYGRGVKSIARELGISEEEAQKYQDLFKANMPEACAWLENSQKFARKHMYVESPLGRRRRLWGYLLEDKRATSQMDRYAINTVIQGVCSDENLIASSLLISFIFAHGKAITQTTPEKAWMLTNLVHDSTEMEVPLEDLYYVLKTFESWYTTKLTYFNKKMFDFNIAIPLEVDMGVGIVYNNIIDWNGSDIHAKELQKWVIKEHNSMYEDNKKAKKVMINHPFFEEYKNTDKKVLKEWCKRIV